MKEVDLFVIGGGSGGVRAARVAASYGAKVMLAEEHRIGGTCVIRGCVPKKLFVYASRFADEFMDAAGFGWTVQNTSFDWGTLVANKDREIARLEAAYTGNLDRDGVEHVKSRASFDDGRTVRLEATGELVRPSNVLIATGSWPHPGDPIPGIEHAISSNEVFEFRELPRSIVVQGGGYTAVEFACVFAGLGSSVTLVYRGENILRGFDADVRSHLKAELERKGIRVLCGAKVTSITPFDDRYRVGVGIGVDGVTPINADKVLFAVGRRPNTNSLHLDRAGVEMAAGGAVKVDRFSQTTAPGIFAVGDVTSRVNLTPVAIREGHAFADTVFGGRPTAVDHACVPTAVFSEPEVGAVGMTEEEAVASLGRVDIYKTTFRPMKATLSGSRSKSLMKLVVDGRTGRVVGCHIVGPDAGELIQIIAIPVQMRATKSDFDAVLAVHPTAAEELVMMRQPILQHGIEPAAA
jgi:glutathione reductase (NADPH)